MEILSGTSKRNLNICGYDASVVNGSSEWAMDSILVIYLTLQAFH